MRCPHCGFEDPEDFVFCSECGQPRVSPPAGAAVAMPPAGAPPGSPPSPPPSGPQLLADGDAIRIGNAAFTFLLEIVPEATPPGAMTVVADIGDEPPPFAQGAVVPPPRQPPAEQSPAGQPAAPPRRPPAEEP